MNDPHALRTPPRTCARLLATVALACVAAIAWPSAAAAEDPPPPPGLTVVAPDGITSVRFQALVQPHHQYRVTAEGADPNRFVVRRAQLRFSGGALVEDFRYKVMVELPGTAGGATANLRDAWIDYRVVDALQLRFGQFLIYDHENLEPSWALQMVDRSPVAYRLGLERDAGIDVHGGLWDRRIEYDVFVVNGLGRNSIDDTGWLRLGGRLALNVLGHHGYRVSDLDHSSEPHLAIGLAVAVDPHHADANGEQLRRGGADVAFRCLGFSAVVNGLALQNFDDDSTDTGFVGRVGYFVMPERLELAARYSRVWSEGDDPTDPEEVAAALSYFISGHGLKVQFEYARRDFPDGSAGPDHLLTSQFQLFL